MDQGQSDRNFGGRHGNHKEHVDVAVDHAELPGEGHEGKVGSVEHQFDAHQHDDGVSPDQYAGRANQEKASR